MKTTVRGVILQLTDTQKVVLDNLMKTYCAAVRWSFKRLLDGWKTQDIRISAQGRFSLNSRQANDAVHDAQTTITSQKELVKREATNVANKVEYTEEWQEVRSNRYLSRGDKTKGGNLNTRLYTQDGNIYLDIAADPVILRASRRTDWSVRYNRITVPVYLAHKPSKKTGLSNGRNYRQLVLDYLKTGNAYQVEIIRESGRYYLHVTIEEEITIPSIVYNGAIGVDTNPAGLGITHADCLGQFKESLWLPQGEWTSARSNRRDNLTGEAAALVVDMAKRLSCALAVENLAFKNDKSVTAKFNRMSHGFVWSKFLQAVERGAAREGIPLAKPPPPFSSVIGILKYQQQYGISNHEAAAYVIARRSLGYSEEKPPKRLVQKYIKQSDAFALVSNWKQWSSVKKAVMAAIKKHTKQEVKSLVSWQHYRKQLLAG